MRVKIADKWMSGEVGKADFAACRLGLSIGHICCLEASDEDGTVVFPGWDDAPKKPNKRRKTSKVKKPSPKRSK